MSIIFKKLAKSVAVYSYYTFLGQTDVVQDILNTSRNGE